jgi:molybdate transport system substrate-binding protein
MIMKSSGLSLRSLIGVLLITVGLNISSALGEEVRVAVAANFRTTFNSIAKQFEEETGHKVLVSPGSSGKLYVQIQNGAPFDLFFSADTRRPELLEQEGLAVHGSRFTYAVGRVTLWSSDPSVIKSDGKTVLNQEKFEYLAIANPRTAPYGQAAVQILKALHVWEQVRDRLVYGENIGQAFQFVFTNNAQLGFVALSQALDPKFKNMGSRWDVPPHLYDPLTQQAVLLKRGQHNPAAKTFLVYMRGKTALDIIEQFGYGSD